MTSMSTIEPKTILTITVVLNVPPNIEQEIDRLCFCSGTIYANDLIHICQDFTDDAIVPCAPWYNCDLRYYSAQISDEVQSGYGNTVFLRVLPQWLFEQLRESNLHNCYNLSQFEHFRDDTKFFNAYISLIKHFTTWLSPLEKMPAWAIACESSEVSVTARKFSQSLTEAGFSIDLPNRYCTSFSRAKSRYVGLHVDNWDNLPISERHLSRSRLVVNLGNGDRWLLFIPHHLQAIRLLCGNGYYSAQEVARWFMNEFPYAPIFRLKIRPGEIYIAPTDNIIHDGSTEGKYDYDIFFSALGRFCFLR